MEISEKEYYELRMHVANLQSQVDMMRNPKKTTLRDLVREQAISRVKTLEDDKPIFGYARFNSDAWTQFLALAKMVHEPSPLFCMDKTCAYGRPYIRSAISSGKPVKISSLTPEQIDVSVQMLNEMIPIYNKYFKQMHQRVMYDPTGRGDYESIGVLDDNMEGMAGEL